MRKATLSGNPALQNKQSLIIEGIAFTANILTRDNIEIAIETADRPDGTKVPIGKTNPGEFNLSIDLADFGARDAFETWAESCIDVPSRGADFNGGIASNYKRGALVIFHRLYSTQLVEDADIIYQLFGCFVTSRTIPDYSMEGTEASTLEMTISYDDAKRFRGGQLPSFANNNLGPAVGVNPQ